MRAGSGQIRSGGVNPNRLHAAVLSGEYIKCLHDSQPILSAAAGFGDPTGPTDGALNLAFWPGFPRGLVSEFTNIGVETILGPAIDATTGLVDISQDQTATEGVIYNEGGLHPRNPYMRTIGSEPAMIYRRTWKIEDASGLATLAFGLFKLEANQNAIDDYDEAFFVDVVAGDVFVKSILNAGATSSTDTGINVTDGDELAIEIVQQGRTCRAKVNVAASGAVARDFVGPRFDFDALEVVFPKGQLLHGTDVSKVYPILSEFGPLSCFESNP